MTNGEPVRQFAAVVGCGTVYWPYQPRDDIRQPVWMWVADGEDAYDAANSLRPWLSAVRRVQLEPVFRAEA